MKKTFLILAILVGFATRGLAYDFQSGNLLYTIISTDPPCVSLDGHIDGQQAQGELVIPETVEFEGVTYTVNEIGYMAFDHCLYLTGDLVIPETVTRIGNWAFSACGIPGTLTLPSSLTEIGKYVFCTNRLTGQLVLPNSLQVIGAGAFEASEGFTGDLVIPESVTLICEDAFRLCSCFDGHLIIGGAVKSIGEGAFYQCSGFQGDLVIPESVEEIGQYAFFKCYGFDGSLKLPTHLTAIEDMTFGWCSGLTGSLVLPEDVTRIGWQAFASCGFTGDLVIPNSVVRIHEAAFATCTGFSDLTIGGAVERIDYIAFAGIPLQSIKLHAETPPMLHYLTFNNVPKDIPVYVPCNTIELYQNAEYWDEFTNFIEDCSLSTEDYKSESFQAICYLNPTKDLVRIDGLNPTEVQIYNTIGQLVKTVQNTNEISLEGLPQGVYLLRVSLEGGKVFADKVVKE